MPSIHTAVEIAAPPRRVWQVLTDLAGYGRWNPLLPELRGWFEVGAPLDLTIQLGGRRVTVGARVTVVKTESELRWRGPRSRLLGRVFAGEHYFLLDATGGGTRLAHGEVFSGLVAPAVERFVPQLTEGFQAMNAALRREAESG